MTQRIAVDPRVHFGKPCVAGSRIPVQNVLELVRDGCSFDQIRADYYPELAGEDIRACIQYAMDLVAVEDLHAAVLLRTAQAEGRILVTRDRDYGGLQRRPGESYR